MPKMAKSFDDLDNGPSVKLKQDEIDYKRFIIDCYPFWSCPYEPGLGSKTGYPDLQLMEDRSKQLLPVELKVGVLKNGRIFPREVRPSQVTWHYEFAKAGGRACLLTGTKLSGRWVGYAVPGFWAEHWRLGYPIADCFFMDSANPVRDLCEIVDVFLNPEAHRRLPSE
jgi:hypothetical protein